MAVTSAHLSHYVNGKEVNFFSNITFRTGSRHVWIVLHPVYTTVTSGVLFFSCRCLYFGIWEPKPWRIEGRESHHQKADDTLNCAVKWRQLTPSYAAFILKSQGQNCDKRERNGQTIRDKTIFLLVSQKERSFQCRTWHVSLKKKKKKSLPKDP